MKTIFAYLKENTRYIINLGSTFLSQAISAASILIMTPVLLHRLGTDDFALYGIILNLVVFSTVFDFGLNMGLLKRLIENPEKTERLISSIFFFFVGGTLFSSIFFFMFFSYKVVDVSNHNLLFAILTAIFVFQNMLALFFDILMQSVNKIFLGRIIRVIKLTVELFVLLGLTYFKSVIILFLGSLVINCIYIYTLIYYSKREVQYRISLQYFNWGLLIDHFKYSFWYFLNSIAIVLVFNTQVMLINRMAPAESVAKYLLVTRFYDVIRLGIANFIIVLFPTIAINQSNGNWIQIKQFFVKTLFRVSLLALIIILFNFLLIKPFFLHWSKYNDAEINRLFLLFGVFIFLILVDNVSATFLSALKFNRSSTIVSIGQGILALTLAYLLLPQYGIIGVVVGSIFALLVSNLIFNPVYLLLKIKMEHGGAL